MCLLAHAYMQIVDNPHGKAFVAEQHLDESTKPAGTYIPFGGGVRRCVGEHLAAYQAVIALAGVFARVRMEPVGPIDLEKRNGIAMAPSRGVQARVFSR